MRLSPHLVNNLCSLSQIPSSTVVSGKIMFDILPPSLKSLAIRSRVNYAPHPYVWMGPAASRSTGLGLESEGKEMPLDELPEWKEGLVKTLPLVWRNPGTGELHLQCHPSGIQELVSLHFRTDSL